MIRNISRTALAQWVRAVALVLGTFGVVFDVEAVVVAVENIGAGFVLIWGIVETIVGLVLRNVTDSPIAKWWGARS